MERVDCTTNRGKCFDSIDKIPNCWVAMNQSNDFNWRLCALVLSGISTVLLIILLSIGILSLGKYLIKKGVTAGIQSQQRHELSVGAPEAVKPMTPSPPLFGSDSDLRALYSSSDRSVQRGSRYPHIWKQLKFKRYERQFGSRRSNPKIYKFSISKT